MKRVCIISLAVVILLGMSVMAKAETIYISQDFEDEAFVVDYQFTSTSTGIGDAATTEGLWRRGYGNGGYPQVSDSYAYSGSKSIKIARPASGQGYRLWGYSELTGGGINTGQLVASAYFNRGGTSGTCAFGPNAASNANAQAMSPSGGGYVFISDGELWARTWKGDSTWSDSIASIPATGWFGVAMELDFDAGVYSVWFDNGSGFNEVASDIEMADSPLAVEGILFVPQAPSNSNVWIDDVVLRSGTMAPVPEPSTLALVVCGLFGLLAYAWRNQK